MVKGAGTFPTETIKNAYVFQVGYHQRYGLTGALPDSHDCPQGYARGDVEIGTFFKMSGTSLQAIYFRCNQPGIDGPAEVYATPRPVRMR